MKTDYSQIYVAELGKKFETERAREHAYRPALNSFFEAISNLNVLNDPKRSEYGAPDFVFLKNKIVIAYAEAKDVTVSLDETAKSEQLERYYGYSNLILTNYLEFRFYKIGQPYGNPIKIGEIKTNKIVPIEANFSLLEDALKDFLKQAYEPITSGVVLSKVMAGKARRIRDNIRRFLESDDEKRNESLLSIYNAIKKLLLADLDYEKFADMYAQTLVYGLFVAKFYDKTQDAFTRQKARDLVPVSNPFLRQFFDHIAGVSFDSRLKFIVDELCEEFTHTDVRAIVHNYYKTDKDPSRDPIIHFYEDFLKEYNPKERLSMGVFYTPLPVVDFIVRSIDEILKKDFNLQGLADSSKVEIIRKVQNTKVKKEVHKVQILDPATGTGTFLNETILHIKKSFIGQEGRWPKYAKEELLPRLHGFELMMAPYTIAHLKISSTLKETGAEIGEDRIGIYLTDSLEKVESRQPDLFSFGLAQAITKEAQEAGEVKNELPIMIVLGNPPYSGISQNKHYTENNVYKVEPGGRIKLKERKNWLDDDYVKFIRFAESLIEKNRQGVVGMITAHGYIDNPTFRGMRWHLRNTFDVIYVLDLHGNSNKKEISPDGTKDENVFDIKTGVSIFLGVKKKPSAKNKKLATIYRAEIYGLRENKQAYLNRNDILTTKWIKLLENVDVWKVEGHGKEEYEKGFSVSDLFNTSGVGVVTARDSLTIDLDKNELWKRVLDFSGITEHEARLKYSLGKDAQSWKVKTAQATLIKEGVSETNIRSISYRPFDQRYIYYSNKSSGFLARPSSKIMNYFINGDNIALVICRQVKSGDAFNHVFISNKITESTLVSNRTSEIGTVFPLYIYEKDGIKFPNFNKEIYEKIVKELNQKVEPENILDYVYGYLYSPSYREKNKEFLKSDFPRVPYPKSEKQFFELVKLGEELRKLHLLESSELSKRITTYPESGDNEVEKVEYKNGNVYINKKQYFGGVPKEVWEFYIGSYRPAQKWLEYRKDRKLSDHDILHYQEIIIAIAETEKIMKKIDTIFKK
jgi:predicted helicase